MAPPEAYRCPVVEPVVGGVVEVAPAPCPEAPVVPGLPAPL